MTNHPLKTNKMMRSQIAEGDFQNVSHYFLIRINHLDLSTTKRMLFYKKLIFLENILIHISDIKLTFYIISAITILIV